MARRFPGYRLPPEAMDVVLQPDGGFLAARALHRRPRRRRAGAAAPRCTPRARARAGSRTATACASAPIAASYEADRLVLTAGAWTRRARRSCRARRAERQVLAWLQPLAAGALRARALPGLQPRIDGEGASTGSRCTASPASSSAATTTSGERRPGDELDREPHAEDEALLRGVRRALLPRRRRPDDDAEDVPVRDLARRALPHRPAPRRAAGRGRRRRSRATASSSPGDRRDPGRPRDRRLDAPRHRAVPARPLRMRAERPNLHGRTRRWRGKLADAAAFSRCSRPEVRALAARIAVSSGRRGARTSRACSRRRARAARR